MHPSRPAAPDKSASRVRPSSPLFLLLTFSPRSHSCLLPVNAHNPHCILRQHPYVIHDTTSRSRYLLCFAPCPSFTCVECSHLSSWRDAASSLDSAQPPHLSSSGIDVVRVVASPLWSMEPTYCLFALLSGCTRSFFVLLLLQLDRMEHINV